MDSEYLDANHQNIRQSFMSTSHPGNAFQRPAITVMLNRVSFACTLLLTCYSASYGSPRVTQEPTSVATATGVDVRLVVRAEGDGGLRYQWRRFGAPLPRANSDVLRLPAAKLADTGFYDVVVTDDSGQSVTSQSARVMVQPVAGELYRMDESFAPLIEARGAAIKTVGTTTNGAFYVTGTFSSIAGARRSAIARFKADLSVDPAFAPVINGSVFALVVQADGRLVIGGDFTRINGVQANRIARLNADGSLDPTFLSGSGFSDTVTRLLPAPNGNLLMSGAGIYYNGVRFGGSAVLGSNGQLLQSLEIGNAEALAVRADGQILAAGSWLFRRIKADGSQDLTFIPLELSGYIRSLAVQADGKVIVGGTVTNYGGTPVGRLFRINPDGTLDSSFAVAGGCDGEVTTVHSLPDGRIVVAGLFSQCGGVASDGIVILRADGSCDTSFPAIQSLLGVTAVAASADGGLVAVGIDSGDGSGVVRLNPGGAVTSAAPGLRSRRDWVKIERAIALPRGKWLVEGQFTHVDGVARYRLARLNADGSLDPTFDAGSEIDGYVSAMLGQDDGKVLVGFNRTSRELLIRLNEDGSRDGAFSVGDGFNLIPAALAFLPDGCLAVGGITINGSSATKLRILARDGALVAGLSSPDLANANIRALLVKDNGDMLVGGSFFSDGNGLSQILQVGRDGTTRARFGAGTDYILQCVAVLAEQLDSKVVAGGQFMGYIGGRFLQNIFRLRPDLTYDPEFEIGMKPEVSSIVPLATGGFLTNQSWLKNGEAAPRYITRLTDAGTADIGFDAVDLWNRAAVSLAVADDGRVLVVGADGERGMAFSPQLSLLKADLSPCPKIVSSSGDKVCVRGDTAILSVVATGEGPLTYRWQRGFGMPGGWIDGANGPELRLTGVELTQNGDYTVQVINRFGIATASIHLTVNPIFAIVEQPADTAASFFTWLGVGAEGAGTLRYQWYRGEHGDTSNPIDGATGYQCELGEVDSWGRYWVRVWQGADHLDSRTALVIAPWAPVELAEWVAQGGTPDDGRGPLAAPAGDGVCNLLKFALGVPPMSPVPDNWLPGVQIVQGTGSERFLALECMQNTQAMGIEVGLEASDDLHTWSSIPSVREVVMPDVYTLARVRLRDALPLTSKQRRFLRLVVRLK